MLSQIERGGHSIDVRMLKNFVQGRLGSVHASNLPEDKYKKKRQLDALLFLIFREIPKKFKVAADTPARNVIELGHYGQDVLNSLREAAKGYLDSPWLQSPELGNRLADLMVSYLLKLMVI